MSASPILSASVASSPAPHRAGQKIEQYRERNGMTRPQLAQWLTAQLDGKEVAPQTVYNWERIGKDARPDIRRVLQDAGICTSDDWLHPALDQAA